MWKLVAGPSTGIASSSLSLRAPEWRRGGSRWTPLLSTLAVPSPDWVHGTLLTGPSFGPGGQGAPPSHRRGWSRRQQEDHTHGGHQLPWSFGALTGLAPDGRDRRSEVMLPERGWGVSPRPCRTRSPAPQLGGHLKAPVSFLLCKSPNFLISCFAPSCDGTCRYVTYIIKIPPSKRHCALHEAGRGNCSYLSSARENQVQSSQSRSLKYSWGGGACSQGPSHQVTLLWAHSMQVLWWSCSCTK